MDAAYKSFLVLPERQRVGWFEKGGVGLGLRPEYVEKDFWVCVVLDALFNGRPKGHPRLYFKGGTSLSKVFGLIKRLSEDVDIVISREDLGFGADRDPTVAGVISGKRRARLFNDLEEASGVYVCGPLAEALSDQLVGCNVRPDKPNGQTLYVEYPSLFAATDSYVLPRIMVEAGVRSGLNPSGPGQVSPFIAEFFSALHLSAGNIVSIGADRSFVEKLLILHGAHCRFRDEGHLPVDADRIARHYYDVAVIAETATGVAAISDSHLLTTVREHNLLAFRQASKKFEEAKRGTLRLVPQAKLEKVIRTDYDAMQAMFYENAPTFDDILAILEHIEEQINCGTGT